MDIKAINKTDSGLPTIETSMTWTKLTDGGYDALNGNFDTSKYDYYIVQESLFHNSFYIHNCLLRLKIYH